jgi:HEXXH motif-containing protein
LIARHVISQRDFGLLAAGDGDVATIEMLLASQYSRRVLLIQAVHDSARRNAPGSVATLDAAYGLLADIQKEHPEIIRAALTMPDTGSWIVKCLRDGGPDRADTYRYLACVAAAAALRSGREFEADVPALNGVVPLPAVGMAYFTNADARTARITSAGRSAGISVVLAGTGERVVLPADYHIAAPGWCPAHLLRARAGGCEIAVWLDDFSPYRAPSGLESARRLTAGEAARWHSILEQAWQLLVREHPERAAAMAAWLRVLTPLHAHSSGLSDSATDIDAFGGVLLTAPQSGPSLALTLLHEFQHGKLATLQNLMALHTSGPRAHFYAPWRDDPRPLGALLHGAYAHLGVAEYWQAAARRGDCRHVIFAQEQFVYWCSAVREALDQLAASGELTAAGTRFTAGMMATLDRLQEEPLPARARQLAADRQMSDRITWRIRHLEPDPTTTDKLARAWLAGRQRPPGPRAVGITVRPGGRASIGSTRQLLARRIALFADRLGLSLPPNIRPTTADLAYARGEYVVALAGYRGELTRDPAQVGAWAGLALTLRRLEQHGKPPDGLFGGLASVAAQPEVVRAVCSRILTLCGQHPDPVALAAWLRQTGVGIRMR